MPGRFRALGGLAGHFGARNVIDRRLIEERHGYAGALPSAGGVGGPFRGPPN
jgi:hypothetical protein